MRDGRRCIGPILVFNQYALCIPEFENMIKEKIAKIAVFFFIVAIPVGIFFYQYNVIPGKYGKNVKIFNITAVAEPSGAYTLHDVMGLNYWWKRFPPMTILLETGDEVVFRIGTADVTHQFYIPALNLEPVPIAPGHIAELRFSVEEEGIYQYFCTTMCGDCHTYMTGWIVVSSKDKKIQPPNPIVCPLCYLDFGKPPQEKMIDLGEYFYQTFGCISCHGAWGRGGVKNFNYAKTTIPPHNTTAAKLFLRTPEAARTFFNLLEKSDNLNDLAEQPDIPLFNVVLDRYNALKQIIKNGSTPEKLDPSGPAPPLWMPSWKYRLTDREIDALILYFIDFYLFEADEAGNEL